MITDLANLGPSLRGTTDLGGAKARETASSANAKSGQPEQASNFDQIFKSKVSEKPTHAIAKSDKDSRVSELSRDPKPVQDDMDDQAVDTDRAQVSAGRDEPRTAPKEKRSWDEPGSVKEKRISEKSEKKSESSSHDREQVMLKFMDSMESEFGIPPQRLVEAMTEIPESDQLNSPEDSASQVVAQLDLPKDQEQKALALYMSMLTQLKQTQEPAWKPAMLAGAGGGGAAALMSNQQRKALLNNSLDQMNQKFFMKNAALETKPGAGRISEDSLLEQASAKDSMSFGDRLQQGAINPMDLKKEALNLQQQPQTPPPNGYGAEVEALKKQLAESKLNPKSPEAQQLAKALAALGASAAALDQGLKTDPQNAQALKAEQVLNSMGLNGQQIQAATGAGDDEDSDDMSDLGEGSSKREMQIGPHHAHAAHTHAPEMGNVGGNQSFSAMMAGGAAAGAKGMNEAEKEANLHQLMNQAQYMIKKGGGEAKIQMAPEGIGQVHMKVTVLDGKVNLEMSAESKEAKKLIESSMNELRSGLAQHRLSMDHVKVDVGNHLASENNNSESQSQQRQMDMRQDQSKNQAREFWSQFGDGGGFDRRGGFFDNPGLRAYGLKSREPQALTPTSPGAASSKAYTGSGKGRGLNLVA